MKFESLTKSDRKGKKLKIVFSNPAKTLHFGSAGSQTFLDHGDETKRNLLFRLQARHKPRENWSEVNPGSLSARILWGPSTDLETNLKAFLKRFNIEFETPLKLNI